MKSKAKTLISILLDLAKCMRATIPLRKRNYVLKKLIEKREHKLYLAACAVESDDKLNKEMKENQNGKQYER